MKIDLGYGVADVREFGGTTGGTVVLLHPLATSGNLWSPFGQWLGRDGRTVIAPTLPVPGTRLDGLSVSDLSAQVAATLDAAGTGPVDLFGMSMGGCIAQQLVLDRPDLVRRLALADTTAMYGPNRVAAWEERAVSAETSARTALLDFQLPRWFTEDFRANDPGECARVAQIFVDTDAAVHAACCRALGGFDVAARLGEITVPTLVLVGEGDYATPPAMARALADGIPGASLEILPDAGHFSVVQSRRAWELIEAHFTPTTPGSPGSPGANG